MNRVELCGGIGAGKSTCGAYLAERWRLPLLRERFEDIPYWKLFYTEPNAYALEKDLSFLLSHADGMRSIDAPLFICDFAMFQTVAYSQIAGSESDTAAVDAVHQRMVARVGHPNLLLRLRCDPGLQMKRIRDRGRVPELGITRDYLDRLEVAIDERIARLPLHVRVMDVDANSAEAQAAVGNPEVDAAIEALIAQAIG